MRSLSLPLLLLLATGCEKSRSYDGPPVGTDPDDTGEPDGGGDSGDTGAPITWLDLPADCTAPSGLGEEPIQEVGSLFNGQEAGGWFMEMVDLEIDTEEDVLYGVGQGGVIVVDVSNPNAPENLAHYPEQNGGRYYKVELLAELDLIYVTHRDRGLDVFAIDDPTDPQPGDSQTENGLEGMARSADGSLLYVASLLGDLHVFDLSNPEEPQALTTLGGLGVSWDIKLSGSTAYIADSELGVVPVDLSDPDAPVLGTPVDVGGAVQDIAVGDGVIYAAAGHAGVVTLDISSPMAPAVVDTIDYGNSVIGLAIDGTTLWAVNQQDIIAIDVSVPGTPVAVGASVTPQFSMSVGAADGRAYVGDWNFLEVWEVDTGVSAPALDLGADEVFVRAEGDQFRIKIANRGAAPLELAGALVDDDRFTVQASSLTVAPGATESLQVSFAGDGEEVAAQLCLATNDPGEPEVQIELHSGTGGNHEAIGEPAIDFTLEDLDGNSHTLSEQVGVPVVLVYFATW